ncbi:MAG: hypothetical protein F6K09_01225 [Merismopedia sp. SIO2A8]|nr:hypothetical protein [Symploca sp. SIO2B6]NET47350.1 hypothetical protein [Merismopedia sp. SIO2A8]
MGRTKGGSRSIQFSGRAKEALQKAAEKSGLEVGEFARLLAQFRAEAFAEQLLCGLSSSVQEYSSHKPNLTPLAHNQSVPSPQLNKSTSDNNDFVAAEW